MTYVAIVTKPFPGCPDGEVYPRSFEKGDEISGDLAAQMVEAGFARNGKKKSSRKPAPAASEQAPENGGELEDGEEAPKAGEDDGEPSDDSESV